MNKVIFMGRLGKDPIQRQAQTEGGTFSARFSLAVDDGYRKKDQEVEPDWIPCVVFGAKAEALVKYCKQGTRILVTGRLKTGKYQSKDTNEWIYTWNVVVDEWEFAESKNSNKTNSTVPETNQYQPQQEFQDTRPAPTPNTQAQQQVQNDTYCEEEVPEGFLSDIDGGGFFE